MIKVGTNLGSCPREPFCQWSRKIGWGEGWKGPPVLNCVASMVALNELHVTDYMSLDSWYIVVPCTLQESWRRWTMVRAGLRHASLSLSAFRAVETRDPMMPMVDLQIVWWTLRSNLAFCSLIEYRSVQNVLNFRSHHSRTQVPGPRPPCSVFFWAIYRSKGIQMEI
jgi:hypothetical protein